MTTVGVLDAYLCLLLIYKLHCQTNSAECG